MILTEAIPTRTVESAVALSPAQLLGVLQELAHERARWRALVEHRPDERWFLRLSAHDGFDTWLIGWDSHQGVDLHDHGGSAGAFYVVDGELLETSTRRGLCGRLRGAMHPGRHRACLRPGPRAPRRSTRGRGRHQRPRVLSAPGEHGLLRGHWRGRRWSARTASPRWGPRSGRGELR